MKGWKRNFNLNSQIEDSFELVGPLLLLFFILCKSLFLMSGIKEIPDLGLGIRNTGSQVRYLKKNRKQKFCIWIWNSGSESRTPNTGSKKKEYWKKIRYLNLKFRIWIPDPKKNIEKKNSVFEFEIPDLNPGSRIPDTKKI